MKKTTIILVAMLVTLGFVGFVCAQEAAQQPAQASQPAAPAKKAVAKYRTLTGQVVSVDATASTITVKNKKGVDTTFKVDAQANIKKGGKKAALSDISAGDSIKVSYRTNKAGESIVIFISAKSPAPAKK